jgi:hypothetical protein
MKPSEELGLILKSSIEKFSEITENEWSFKPKPGKWSRKELLGHLVDSAGTNLRRFVYAQYKQKEKIVYYQDEWVKYQNYQKADTGEIILLWKLLNLQIIRTMENMPEEKHGNVCDTGKEAPELHSLSFLMEDYVVHLNYHLRQILA